MVAGDFQAALPFLRDAEVHFGAAAKPGGFKEFRMIEAGKGRPPAARVSRVVPTGKA
jgi:hypothetical protein